MKTTRNFFTALFLIAYCFFVFVPHAKAFKLTVIADIHAGGNKTREKSYENTLYPINFEKNLEIVKKSKPEVILVVGDMINFGEGKKTAKRVKEILKPYTTLYVKGNHDGQDAWSVFSKSNDYVFDKGNWRFIIVDSSRINSNKLGGVTDKQILWLKKKLDTNKKVVIGMHHPILEMADKKYTVIPGYESLKSALEEAGNVRYVFSGHVHTRNKCREKSGIKYCAQRALSVRNFEGSFSEYQLK